MELLNPSLRNMPFIVPHFSLSTRKFSIKIRDSRSPSKFKFHKNPSSTTTTVHVSAHFRRPMNRRNSLRKKLFDHQQVRQDNPLSPNPTSDVQNPNLYLDDDSVKEKEFGYVVGLVEPESAKTWDTKSKKLGESILSTKLEEWVNQYNKDAAIWGIGSAPIFTVFNDFKGNVKRVLVHEDEILKRSQVEKHEFGGLKGMNSRILYAKDLAREMERGRKVIPRNSSVAKFVVSNEESGLVNTIHNAVLQPELIPVLSGFGKMIFCGFVAVWAMKKLFTSGNKEEKLTESEKEMTRRKIKSRRGKKMVEEGRVEIVQEPSELPMTTIEKPKMDKLELMRNILEAKGSKDRLVLMDSSNSQTTSSMDFDEKNQKIRAMAREAQEIQSGQESMANTDVGVKQPVNDKSSSGMVMFEVHTEEAVSFLGEARNRDSGQRRDIDETRVNRKSLEGSKSDDTGYQNKVSSERNRFMPSSRTSSVEAAKDRETMARGEGISSSDSPDSGMCMSKESSITKKPGIIRSIKEAREFLAKKGNKYMQEPQVDTVHESPTIVSRLSDKVSNDASQRVEKDRHLFEPVNFSDTNFQEDSVVKVKEFVSTKKDDSKDSKEGYDVHNLQNTQALLNSDANGRTDRRQAAEIEKWMEKNFHEVEPIIKKIGDGFKDNYKVARENGNQPTGTDVTHLCYNEDDSELEWMKDDDLREIVFQVRENELSGRDPFYLMDSEDKLKFLKGLEKKVEKENEKLFQVHEYLHSNIENLDYGADGISLYDPPEKFVPRWKGPPLEKNPEFLNNYLEQRNAISAGNAGTSHLMKKDEQNLTQKSMEFPVNGIASTSLSEDSRRKNLCDKNPKDSRTVIEGSDGSIRPGKKTGKEYWQHTKKWSRGFLESYNSVTDPEIKSTMKDIGKDLDRWITEEEIQEAAELMKKLPERNKEFMEKKINKLKREMELFGPQAVVSKYREYAEEKEEDYLWWLDLPHILCIELYTTQNGEQKIGFYSLEMAADLELEPKPCHVIAFEYAGDCKNFCCIIQAHMDMLGNGYAFVVPRPPKDAFRDAKANGFGVTVIRKRELKLNVDQTLEEVEEQITEIGSKMYHDKLIQERSVDISGLMKGVFGVNGQTATTKGKRSNRKLLKKRSKK